MTGPTFTPDRIDREPVVLGKCTRSETTHLLLASVLLMLPVALIIGGVTGAWPAAVGAQLLGTLALASVGVATIGAMKRNRPVGYFTALSRIKLRSLKPTPFIYHSGRWQGEVR